MWVWNDFSIYALNIFNIDDNKIAHQAALCKTRNSDSAVSLN